MAQQRLIGDISHEIKSPLAGWRALGLAQRSPAMSHPKQFDRMEREIGNISALASETADPRRLDGAAASVAFAPVDLRGAGQGNCRRRVLRGAGPEARYRDPRAEGRDYRRGQRRPAAAGDRECRAERSLLHGFRTPITIVIARRGAGCAAVGVHDEGPACRTPRWLTCSSHSIESTRPGRARPADRGSDWRFVSGRCRPS